MRYFRYEHKANELTIYPIVCVHAGAEQHDEKFFDEAIARIADDPNGRWLYMGDGGECVTKLSKGDVYSQTMSPQKQQNYLVAKLKPIAKKALFAIDGNHGRRIYKETGLSFDETLAAALGVPYLGTAAFWNLVVRRSIYDIYTHHGVDSGVAIASKVTAAKKLTPLVAADAIFSAHSHIAMELPPTYRAVIDDHALAQGNNPIRYQSTYEYVAGSSYDSRTGYAEEKAYPPILPSYIAVTFSGKIVGGFAQKAQRMQLWRAEA